MILAFYEENDESIVKMGYIKMWMSEYTEYQIQYLDLILWAKEILDYSVAADRFAVIKYLIFWGLRCRDISPNLMEAVKKNWNVKN